MVAAERMRTRWPRRIVVAAVIISAGFFLRYWFTRPRIPDEADILARVGTAYLSTTDLLDGTKNPDPLKVRTSVERWVETELLAQAAIAEGLDSDPSIDKRSKDFRRELLADAYLRFASWRLRDVSEDEVEAYYNKHRSGFVLARPEVKAYHFILDNQTDAANLARALRTGNDAARAELLSQYQGEVKSFAPDAVLPELSRAVFMTRLRVVGPIKTVHGYHVLDVISRRDAGAVRSIEEIRDEIVSQIMVTRHKRLYYEILDSLKAAADVQMFEARFAGRE